jgi:large subunit ribosomal protein L25
MGQELVLPASKRKETGRAVNAIRRQGILPVVMYGHGIESRSLGVPKKSFEKVFAQAGKSTLVDVAVEKEKPIKVLIHDVQLDPLTDDFVHADLYQVNLTEKVQTEVPIKFVGESPAVKDQEGNLITQKSTIKVEALPRDLPREIEADISRLATFDDVLKVSDLHTPPNVAILETQEEVVALVTPPKTEEELQAELAEPVAEAEKAQIAEIEATAEAEKAAKVSEEGAEEGATPAEGQTPKAPVPEKKPKEK